MSPRERKLLRTIERQALDILDLRIQLAEALRNRTPLQQVPVFENVTVIVTPTKAQEKRVH